APTPSGLYTLSLHDALPIYEAAGAAAVGDQYTQVGVLRDDFGRLGALQPRPGLHERDAARHPPEPHHGRTARARRAPQPEGPARSEEHTSELQSRSDLVCRL